MRQRIRLTEGDLHRIVKESVMRILKEAADHKITYNGQDYTLNADNQSSWYKLGDIRKDMAKPYKQMADDASHEADKIIGQEGFFKNPQLQQQYIDANNRRSQNNAIADKYQEKAWRNDDNGFGIARRDLERFNRHLDNYFGTRE